MKKTAFAVSVFLASAVTQAQPGITGRWQAEVQPGVFWTLTLRSEGSRLTGVVEDRVDPVEFYDGTIVGNTASFKVATRFGEPIIVFTGIIAEDQIEFTRDVQGQGRRPLPGMLSPAGPRQFTVRRVPEGQPPKETRGTPFPQQLVVYDRSGKVLQRLGESAQYNWPTFSPDGKKLVVALQGYLWVFELSTGTRIRVTTPPWLAFAPAWSPDGRQLTYFYWRGQSAGAVYQRPSDGAGTEERLYETERGASAVIRDWSGDRRWLSFDSGDVLFTLPLTGERKAVQLAPGEHRMRRAHFSPDNRFLAYESDESGQFEVFVQAFDPDSGSFLPSGGKWQVSVNGGGMAHWREDGRELIYLGADGGVRAVSVSTTPALSIGTSNLLFRVPSTLPPLAQCFCVGEKSLGAVSRDGQQMAFVVPMSPPRNELKIAPDILSRYTGRYELFGADVNIALQDDHLVASGLDTITGTLVVRDPARLLAQSQTSFFFQESSGEIDFVSDEDGRTTSFLLYEGGPPTKAIRK